MWQPDAAVNEKGKDSVPQSGAFVEALLVPPIRRALTKPEASRRVLQHPFFSFSQLGKHI